MTVGRHNTRHRESIYLELLPCRLNLPARIEQKSSSRQRTHLLALGLLGNQNRGGPKRGQKQYSGLQSQFHSEYLCAIGKRRPIPNALVVTLRPGAACCLLYSLRSTFNATSFTSPTGSDSSSAICCGALNSSIYPRKI